MFVFVFWGSIGTIGRGLMVELWVEVVMWIEGFQEAKIKMRATSFVRLGKRELLMSTSTTQKIVSKCYVIQYIGSRY